MSTAASTPSAPESRVDVLGVGDGELVDGRRHHRRLDLVVAVVDVAPPDGGGQLRVVGEPERVESLAVCDRVLRSELDLALHRAQDVDGDARVELHAAFGGRHDVVLEELAHRLYELRRRRTVVRCGHGSNLNRSY